MFEDRQAAGRQLAEKLQEYKNSKTSIILAIPRGGVVVGAEISSNLKIPLDILSVKKIGAPHNPELAIGAVGQGGRRIVDWAMIGRLGVNDDYLEKETEKKLKEVNDRLDKYGSRPEDLLNYSNFILTDDGVATGATTKAAVEVVRKLDLPNNRTKKIILAVPVIAKEVEVELRERVDRLIVIEERADFGAVGQFYKEFSQVEDEEVIKILNKTRRQK